MELQRFQYLRILSCRLKHGLHDGFLQDAFLNARRVVAVLLAVVKAADAPPYDLFLSVGRPCASAIGRSAFSANQKLRERVLAGITTLLRFCSDLLDLPLSIPPRHFFLHSAEGSGVDDGRMIVLDVVFRALSVIDHDLLGQAVSDIGLVENGVTLVFFVSEDRFNRSPLPSSNARRRWNPVVVEVVCYRGEAVACEESLIDPLDHNRLFGIDLRLSVRSSAIPKESLVLEGYVSFFRALCLTPAHVGADVLRFALSYGTVDCDIELSSGLDAVDPLFLEVHVHIVFFQHPSVLQAVEGVSCEAGYRFSDDHIDLALFAVAHEPVELIPFLDARAGDAFVGVDADHCPTMLPVDFVRVSSALNVIAVELILLFRRNSTVGSDTKLFVSVFDFFL